MKSYIRLFFLSFVMFLYACDKDEINNTEEKVGISRVTHFATFQMSGAKFISIVQGSTYADPGIKAFEGDKEIPVTTTGSVNVNTPGIYNITYSAKNKDDFTATTNRTVIVLSGPETPGVDLSGKYSYVGSSTYVSTVTKVAQGTYTTDNSWSGATIIPIIFVSLNGTTLTIPNQTTAFGPAFGTGSYNTTTGRMIYTISLPSFGISNSSRNWQKQ